MADLVVAVIPARYGSERLPGKPLLPLAGKPILAHTFCSEGLPSDRQGSGSYGSQRHFRHCREMGR